MCAVLCLCVSGKKKSVRSLTIRIWSPIRKRPSRAAILSSWMMRICDVALFADDAVDTTARVSSDVAPRLKPSRLFQPRCNSSLSTCGRFGVVGTRKTYVNKCAQSTSVRVDWCEYMVLGRKYAQCGMYCTYNIELKKNNVCIILHNIYCSIGMYRALALGAN